MTSWKKKAEELRTQTYALYLAYRDPRTSWYARIFIALIVAYAFSPIDLIPDFIPVLGYLDDLVIIPLGVVLAMKMIPRQVMEESRVRARSLSEENLPEFKIMGAIVIALWVLSIFLVVMILVRKFR